ncbi:MAG TPA: hypothetical protein VIF62_10090, partial [Labilithrix sp.]
MLVALAACRTDPTPAAPPTSAAPLPSLAPAAIASESASADAMPTLSFDAFLAELDDRARRQELYRRFVAA